MSDKLYDSIFLNNEGYNLADPSKVKRVLSWLDYHDIKEVLDVGCGRGHYLAPVTEAGVKVTGLEPSEYLCRKYLQDYDVICSDILGLKKSKRRWPALYCMDVLEHVKPEDVEDAVGVLARLAPRALLGVANHSDVWGGVELHLIQENEEWWGTLLKKYYKTVNLTYTLPRFYIFEVEV